VVTSCILPAIDVWNQIPVDEAVRIFDGKSVAVVGNAMSILKYSWGGEIDSCDIVVRMNSAIPTDAVSKSIGTKTNVLTLGRLFCYEDAKKAGIDPSQIWWMKFGTETGTRELNKLLSCSPIGDSLVLTSEEIESPVKKGAGKSGSTGARFAYILTSMCSPKSVALYGMDCFGAAPGGAVINWWRDRRIQEKRRASHNGQGEFDFIKSRGFCIEGGKWVHTHHCRKENKVPVE